jgi:hypothetical protein
MRTPFEPSAARQAEPREANPLLPTPSSWMRAPFEPSAARQVASGDQSTPAHFFLVDENAVRAERSASTDLDIPAVTVR